MPLPPIATLSYTAVYLVFLFLVFQNARMRKTRLPPESEIPLCDWNQRFINDLAPIVYMNVNDNKIWELPCLLKFGPGLRNVPWDP